MSIITSINYHNKYDKSKLSCAICGETVELRQEYIALIAENLIWQMDVECDWKGDIIEEIWHKEPDLLDKQPLMLFCSTKCFSHLETLLKHISDCFKCVRFANDENIEVLPDIIIVLF